MRAPGKRRPLSCWRRSPVPWIRRELRLRGVDYFVAVPVTGVPGVAGAGCADGGVAVGAVMGVTVTPVTLPLTASFCFLLVVPRAVRVAFAFAAAAAFCSLVLGAGTLGGSRPKSASVWIALENAARTNFR